MAYENIENFDPRTCINGKIHRLQRTSASIFRKYMRPFGVTSPQTSLLFVMSKRDGLTQKQITEILRLEKSSLNRNLKRLFERELLSRTDFPIIRITEKGKVLVNEIIPEWKKAMKEIKEFLGNDGEVALDLVLSKVVT